jgi:hypothetical protein
VQVNLGGAYVAHKSFQVPNTLYIMMRGREKGKGESNKFAFHSIENLLGQKIMQSFLQAVKNHKACVVNNSQCVF